MTELNKQAKKESSEIPPHGATALSIVLSLFFLTVYAFLGMF